MHQIDPLGPGKVSQSAGVERPPQPVGELPPRPERHHVRVHTASAEPFDNRAVVFADNDGLVAVAVHVLNEVKKLPLAAPHFPATR